jgi:hypothetical protein
LRALRLPLWVKLGNTQTEHSSSEFPPTTDIARFLGWFSAQLSRVAVISENCRPWAEG